MLNYFRICKCNLVSLYPFFFFFFFFFFQVVGRNVGQALKKEVHIKNLPPIFKTPRPKQPSVVETDSELGLTSLFGSDSNGLFSFPSSV